MPVAAVTPARLSLWLLFLLPVRHQIHLSVNLQDTESTGYPSVSKVITCQNKKTLRRKQSDLVWLVDVVEWRDPPRPLGVVPVACDALQPLRHRLLIDFLRVDPSAAFNTRVHPHWMIAGLEWLDTSIEKYL